MSANIATSATGERLAFYAGVVPWHGLGEQLSGDIPGPVAIKKIGADFPVTTGPAYGGPQNAEIRGWRTIYREDTGEPLGMATASYTPIPYGDAVSFTDELLADGILRYRTGGLLGRGERFWLLASLGGELRVAGAEQQDYLLVTSGHDGHHALQYILTRVTVVCQNTLDLALRSRSSQAVGRVSHHGDVAEQFATVKREVQIVSAARERLNQWQESLAALRTEDEHVARVEQALFPPLKRKSAAPTADEAADGEATDSLDEATSAARETALARWRNVLREEQGMRGQTGFALMQAVTGYTDHELQIRERTDGTGRLRSFLDGAIREKKHAGLAALAAATKLPLPV